MVSRATGCKNSYSLMRLATHDRTSQTAPDAMHTVTDVTEKLVYLITGNESMLLTLDSKRHNYLGKTNSKLNGRVTMAEGQLTRSLIHQLKWMCHGSCQQVIYGLPTNVCIILLCHHIWTSSSKCFHPSFETEVT